MGEYSLYEKLVELCELHDKIKDSPIRKMGLDGKPILSTYKQRYYNIIIEFVEKFDEFILNNREERDVIYTIQWMDKSYGFSVVGLKEKLDNSYLNTDPLEFVVEVDFTVFSIIHYFIEYLHYKKLNKCWTPDFIERINIINQ